MAKKKNIPKWATTVTPFSKFLALSMLVIFPIVGFYWGMNYQYDLDKATNLQSQPQDLLTTFIPQPDKLVVSRLENKTYNLSPFTNTITDTQNVQQLYKELDGFKYWPPGKSIGSCPMMSGIIKPTHYDLTFYKNSTILRHVTFFVTGCRDTITLDNNEDRIGITKESVDFENTLRQSLNLSNTEFRGYGND